MVLYRMSCSAEIPAQQAGGTKPTADFCLFHLLINFYIFESSAQAMFFSSFSLRDCDKFI